MAPGSSAECAFGPAERATLLALAGQAIRAGLDGERLRVEVEAFAPALAQPRASFVTLNLAGRLRGCMGTLEARRALVLEVAEMAHAAAFGDPRFPALAREEFERIELHISVLSPPELLVFDSEEELLGQLRPGIDGLILSERHARGTFLPSVWEQLPEPREFLARLKQKAGLDCAHWSDAVRVERYTTESIP
ncbi:MAG TPA: AmmeMemoRadiSam system protein A [Pseudomonadales bacterium]|nr:AmmeMemoRadiSam system protein A [Pseudomonadales bacterium]